MGHLGIVRTAISRHIFRRICSLGIELEGLLGWQIHMGMPWSPHLYSIIGYGLSYGPFTLWDGHRVGGKVTDFPTHMPAPVRKNVASLTLSAFRPCPSECLP